MVLTVCFVHRDMNEMWDDTETDRCRQAFIKGLYKFPKCPTAPLRTGRPMPLLGIGPWRTAEGGVQDMTEKALRSGIRRASSFGKHRTFCLCSVCWHRALEDCRGGACRT